MRRLVLPLAGAFLLLLVDVSSAGAQVLMGDQNPASNADRNNAGAAQAFQYTATASGSATDIDLYVKSGTTATAVSVGLYSDASGKPGSLLASGVIQSPPSQAWNDVKLGGSVSLAQSQRYWIAVLPTGGALAYLDTTGGSAPSYVDSNKNLTSLPQTYSAGKEYNASPASAYVNGTAPSLLLGDQSSAPSADSNAAGIAQAFSYQATNSGTTSDIELYVNSGTTASQLMLGVYSDSNGKPGTRLASGSISSPKPQSWDDVNVGAVSVTRGATYWIALLSAGGQINYPDTMGGSGASYVDSASGLTSLPATYSPGTEYNASPASAYVTGLSGGSAPAAPASTGAPVVSGQAVQGQSVSTSSGSWSGSPTSYGYRWQDCDSSGGSCGNISGATGSSYVLQSGDVGHTVRSVVTASNAGGSASASSAATSVVTASGGGSGGGAQVYVSQSGAGSGSGADCADAKPVTFFNSSANWGSAAGQIGPGVTVDLCGTITSVMTVHGSGVSGNPITVYWEPGASVQQPYCPMSGCFSTNNQKYLTLNGGSNGSIEATQNGTGLANQHGNTYGLVATGCTGCLIEHLTIADMYVRTSTTDDSIAGSTVSILTISGSNWTVTGNTFHDAEGVDLDWANGDGNDVWSYNNEYNINHTFNTIANGSGETIGPVYFFGNHLHDWANWDDTSGNDDFHHNGIHCYTAPGKTRATYTDFFVYDNRFDGATDNSGWGGDYSWEIGLEGPGGGTPCATGSSPWIVFNNVFEDSQPINGGMLSMGNGVSLPTVFNNTLIGSGTTGGNCAWIFGGTVENNVSSTCNTLIANGSSSESPIAFSTLDYNIYANGGTNSVGAWEYGNKSWSFGTNGFSSWKSSASNLDQHSSEIPTASLNSDGSPQTGSPVLGSGTNLTSLCHGYPTSPANVQTACETTYTGPPANGNAGATTTGNTRPTSGAWNTGAY